MSISTIEELDACRFLYLQSISEPDLNALKLVLSEGIVSDRTETLAVGTTEISGLRAVEVAEKSRHFEVVWESYISYAIRDESYCDWDKQEAWTGSTFRVYSRSKFLDFVTSGTFASATFPGPFVHYEIICCDHIIDVASQYPPTIRIVGA